MDNRFLQLYNTLGVSEKAEFERYIGAFYAHKKMVLAAFAEVTLANSTACWEGIEAKERHNKFNMLSELTQWFYDFLVVKEVQQRDNEHNILLLNALERRSIGDLLPKKRAKFIEEAEKSGKLGLSHLLYMFRLRHYDYFNTDTNKLNITSRSLIKASESLDALFCFTKMKYATELISRQHIMGEDWQLRFLNEVTAALETDSRLESIKQVALLQYRLKKEKSYDAYLALKDVFYNVALEKADKYEIMQNLMYFSAVKMLADTSFCDDYMSMTEVGLREGLFTYYGYFPTITFTNIVLLYFREKNLEKATAFVDEWSPYLKPADKPITLAICRARIAFEEERWHDVHLEVAKVRHHDMSSYLTLHVLLARAYYEDGKDADYQISHLSSVYNYIKSKKLTTAQKARTVNFISIMKLLINKKSKAPTLLSKMHTYQGQIWCSDWLELKIAVYDTDKKR